MYTPFQANIFKHVHGVANLPIGICAAAGGNSHTGPASAYRKVHRLFFEVSQTVRSLVLPSPDGFKNMFNKRRTA